MMATQGDTGGSIKHLLESIISHNPRTVEALIKRHPELVNTKYESKAGFITPLISACHSGMNGDSFSGSLPLVRLLLKNGADISATGCITSGPMRIHLPGPPIIHTVQRLLGGYGACDGIFPLFITARRVSVSVVEELLFAGAPVNQTSAIGQSALHAASMNYDGSNRVLKLHSSSEEGTLQVMRTLIENGANVNSQDVAGKTPMHYACEHNNRYLVKILLEKAADITLRDNKGLSALDIAAHFDYEILQTIIERCKLPNQDIIDAYETVALITHNPFEHLAKATEMRRRHNIPKTVQEPLECYGSMKEWETLKELRLYEDDHRQLRLQAILARERIWKGKYVNFMKEDALQGILQTQSNRFNAVLKHHLNLFKENDDYLYFADVFVMHDSILNRLLHPAFAIDNDTLTATVNVAFESCIKMQDTLMSETKPGAVKELISQLETTLVAIGAIILKLFEINDHADYVQRNCRELAEVIFKELWQKFPEVVAPSVGYKSPLPHILLSNNYKTFMFTVALTPNCLQYQFQLMKMFVSAGIDVNMTDSEGNTLLHTTVTSLPNDIKWYSQDYVGGRGAGLCAQTTENIADLLLQNGAYLRARNNKRKSVFDILGDPLLHEYVLESLTKIMGKYEQFPSLEHLAAIKVREAELSYHDQLPEAVVKFVDLH